MNPRARRRGWMFDERASAGAENLDPAHVARYDGKMDAEAEAEVAILLGVGLTRRSTVVEFGSGTGQFALAVAPHCGRLVAVDPSAPMMERLRQKLAEARLDGVELAEAGFLTYRHAGPPADIVYSRFALHHLPDAWKAMALSRIRAMLRPGGLFRLWDVVYDFPLDAAPDRLEAWCATGGDEVEGEWSRAEIEDHVRDEHSTFAWLLEAMLGRAGFETIDVARSPDGFESRYLLRAA